MADEITVRGGDSMKGRPFAVHPATTCAARIADVVNLGPKVEAFPGSPEHLSNKVALVVQSSKINPDTKKPFEPFLELTLSFHEKANLRKVLEALRGRPYTEVEAEHGIPLHKLVDFRCLVTVAHKTARSGNTFGKIMGLSPMPEGMPSPEFPTYTRNDKFWDKKKEAYHAETVAFETKQAREAENVEAFQGGAPESLSDFPAALDGDVDSDLPFAPDAGII